MLFKHLFFFSKPPRRNLKNHSRNGSGTDSGGRSAP